MSQTIPDPDATRRAPAVAAWPLLILALPLLAGCGTARSVAATKQGWARPELVPTYTALPAASPTLTPFPSATATVPYQTPTPDVFQAAGPPVRLEIPAIGVDATIEKVGRDARGHVDVPKIAANVAWFTESALPGQDGKASVIVGHLDDPYGPAVFYDLRRLLPGDELAVTYANGDRHVFVVEGKERYQHDQLPSQRLYGSGARPMLNLLTCDGAWNAGQANYQQRLVVYTSFKQDAAAAP